MLKSTLATDSGGITQLFK